MTKKINITNALNNMGDGNNIIIDSKINLKQDDIYYKEELFKAISYKKQNKEVNIISFVTASLGMLTALIDLSHSLITNQFTIYHLVTFIIGAELIIISIKEIYHMRKLKKESLHNNGHGVVKKIEGDNILNYILKAQCSKCKGDVYIKTAYMIDSKGNTFGQRPLGICENSTENTKHYFSYDEITNSGEILNSQIASKYYIAKR